MGKILDKKEPSKAWLPGESATFLAIIIAIVLVIAVFSLTRNWTIGLTIVLVIAALAVAPLTVKGWLDWRLFRDTAIDSSGIVVQRIHEQHQGDTTIRICTAYMLDGERITQLPRDASQLDRCQPDYEDIPGWEAPTSDVTCLKDLPKGARAYIQRIEELVGIPIYIVSTGPRRHETIMVRDVY